jgi:hypothetical protein
MRTVPVLLLALHENDIDAVLGDGTALDAVVMQEDELEGVCEE